MKSEPRQQDIQSGLSPIAALMLPLFRITFGISTGLIQCIAAPLGAAGVRCHAEIAVLDPPVALAKVVLVLHEVRAARHRTPKQAQESQ